MDDWLGELAIFADNDAHKSFVCCSFYLHEVSTIPII